MRVAMNAILYLLRTGCPWRYLSRDSFPLRSTVYNIFCKFQPDGAGEAIWVELDVGLHDARRTRRFTGRQLQPRAKRAARMAYPKIKRRGKIDGCLRHVRVFVG